MLNEITKWDKIARSFDETRRRPWKICTDFIEGFKEGCISIDIGCGNGRHLAPSSKKSKMVIGLDFSREMLEIAKERMKSLDIKNVNFILAEARHIPIRDSSVDYALSVASLHNIEGREDRIKTLKEINRILKRDGKALITVWYRWQKRFSLYFLKDFFLRRGREFGDMYVKWRKNKLNIDRFYHFYSKRELLKDLKMSGLKILKLEKVKISSKKGYDNIVAIVGKG